MISGSSKDIKKWINNNAQRKSKNCTLYQEVRQQQHHVHLCGSLISIGYRPNLYFKYFHTGVSVALEGL